MKFLLLILVFLTAGCDTLYFYHSNKISINTEVDPADSTQPALINIGVRDRVAMLVPGQDADGEALSSVSSFKFNYESKLGMNNDEVEISSFFITGAAADSLKASSESAQAAFTAAADSEFVKDSSTEDLNNWLNSGTADEKKSKLAKIKAEAKRLDTSVTNFLYSKKFASERRTFNSNK